MKSLKEFKAAPPVSEARHSELIEDIDVLLPPELAFDTEAVAKIGAKIVGCVCCGAVRSRNDRYTE